MDHPHELITIISLDNIDHSQFQSIHSNVARERLTIVFIARGGGGCWQGREWIDLKEGGVYVGLADSFYGFDMEEGCVGWLVSFHAGAAIFRGFFSMSRSFTCLDAESTEEMCWLMTRIYKVSRSEDRYRTEVLHQYVSLLLLKVRAEIEEELVEVTMNRKGLLIKEFFELLEKTFMTARTVDYYAEKLCVSPKHLTNVMKLESGYPTSYHIHQRVILEAKRMAQASGANLKQIAYQLGYEDVAAFSKLFKRVAGVNFSTYKCNLKLVFSHSVRFK